MAAVVLTACSGAAGPSESAYTDGVGLTVQVHPQLTDHSEDPAPADDAAYVLDVQLDDAEEGRPVELQVDGGDGWEVVDEAESDEKGRATLATRESGEHRVVVDGDEPLGVHVDPAADAPAEIFVDDFTADTGLWATRAQGYVGVRTCSRADESAAERVDGVMRLSVLDDPRRGTCRYKGDRYDYRLNGHLGTEGSFNFTYGYAAARIRFQPGRGQHGAFWLQSFGVREPGNPKQTGAEIDVIEYFGDEHPSGGLTSFVYWQPAGAKQARIAGGWLPDPEELGDDWSSQFHVFSVEWTPREYVFRIDGQVTRRIRDGISGQPQFLVISLLSSDYELQHIERDELPQHMDVDWVRVWEQPKR